MAHLKYGKIKRLGNSEVEGILDFPVTVQEKIDGANSSVWKDEDGNIKLGSRNQEIEDMRGLRRYVENHNGILKLLEDYPNFRLFGEWLVQHTVKYDPSSYENFYLFDIYDHGNEDWLSPEEVIDFARDYGIEFPMTFEVNKFVYEETLKKWLGTSRLGEKGEGLVIKSNNFINKFGRRTYAKMVTQDFEENNKVVFGGNNKNSETYYEQKIVNEFLTNSRVKKVVQKIESATGSPLDKSSTPRVVQTVYHDLLEEEIWNIQKKVPYINFNKLKRLCSKKAANIFHELLEKGEKNE